MNQQQEANAMDKINGYFFPDARKTSEQSFNEAKIECVENLREQIRYIELIKFGKFEDKYI